MRRALTASSEADVTPEAQAKKRQILVSAEPLKEPGTRRPRPAETLLAVAKVVGSDLGLTEVLQATTRELARAVRADIGSVWRLEPSERTLNRVAGYRVPKHLQTGSHPLAFAQLLTPSERRSSAPVYSTDSAAERRFDHPFLKLVPHRSVLIQPFRARGQLAGVFVLVWTRARHRFTPVELRLVEAIGQQAGMAIENAELLASLQQFSGELERRVADRTAQLKLASDELRRSREELRALSLHLQEVREQERTRISREIHDELGQALTALKMDLVTHVERTEVDFHSEAMLRAIPMVDHMIASVRRIATELRPQILDDLGLLPALEWQAQDFASRTGIKCRLRCIGTTTALDTERSTALFRMVQETLTNVARHAQATQAQIGLRISRTVVSLDVRDNGRGMRESASGLRAGLGLFGMRERAAAFGGTVIIRSTSYTGTHVRVRIPLATATPHVGGHGRTHAGHHRLRRPSGRPSGTGANHSKRPRRRSD
jgi:signal transduction histidine kinase